MMGLGALQTAIIWQPFFSSTVTIGIGVSLVLLAGVAYWRGRRMNRGAACVLFIMRMASIVGMVVILMGPSAMPESTPAESPPRLYLMVDTSGSMATRDANNQSRLAYLLKHWLNPKQIEELDASFDLRLITIDQSSKAMSLSRLSEGAETLIGGEATHYRDALQQLISPLPQNSVSSTAVVLLGDGHETDDLSLASVGVLAKSRGVKIHGVSVGSTEPTRDLALVSMAQQPYLMPDETGAILIQVHQAGFGDGAASIEIHTPDGNTLKKTVVFDGQPVASISVPITHAKSGQYVYEISVAKMPGEATVANNTHTTFVNVSQEPMRVLILEGEPYWDTKFLAQGLRTDRRIQLDNISQINSEKRQHIVTRSTDDSRGPLTIPRTLQELAVYDAIVLGRGIEHLLSTETLNHLQAYVSDRGGALIFARGLAYDPNTAEGQVARAALAVLEPVQFGLGVMNQIPLELTHAGVSNPAFAFQNFEDTPQVIVGDLPSIDSLLVVDSVKPGATVLAQAATGSDDATSQSTTPAIVTMAYGRGRVFSVLGEGLWRWSFLPPEKVKRRGVFDSFWSNTIRWMVMGGAFEPGQEIALKLSRNSLRSGDAQLIQLTTKSPHRDTPELWVIDPEGVKSQLQIQQAASLQTAYRVSFVPNLTGIWRVEARIPGLDSEAVSEPFSVYDLDFERLNAAARPQVFKELANQTGGLYFRSSENVNFAKQLNRIRRSTRIPPNPIYIWDRYKILTVLLLCIGLEWLIRRKIGWL